MDIELRNIDDIRPYEGNPRVNDQAVDAVAASLREFGFRQPIVVDEAGVIIVGHTPWKAAKKLGLAKVPVHVARDLSPEQVKAYRIADNQTNTLAEWDMDLLPIELKDLQAADFNMELLGFDQEELAKLLDGGVKEGLTAPDDVPAPPDEAITRPGDLWLLGNDRLLCGDSGRAEDVDRRLTEGRLTGELHNRVNELYDVSGAIADANWVDPAYDAAGNMTACPKASGSLPLRDRLRLSPCLLQQQNPEGSRTLERPVADQHRGGVVLLNPSI
jgi:ParB-like chromosome segregation protein Spo0J